MAAWGRINTRKVEGPDGILPITVREAAQTNPQYLLGVMNDLVGDCVFPLQWKEAMAVLLPKSNRGLQMGDSKAYG